MDFNQWCEAHGVYLNDDDDAARAAKAMARSAWDAAASAERERWKQAAEAALKADACIEVLRAIVEQQRNMGFDGSPSDELMDEARRALAAVSAA